MHLEALLEAAEGPCVGEAEGGEVERLAGDPTPSTKRPPVRWSSVRAVCARDAGWRRTRSVTPMPSLTSRVAAAAAATTGTGSNQTCGLRWPAAACGHQVGRPDREREPVQQVVGPPDRVEALLLAALGRLHHRLGRRAYRAHRRQLEPGVAAMAANYSAPVGALQRPRVGPAGSGRRRAAATPRGRRPARRRPSRRGPRRGAGQVHDERAPAHAGLARARASPCGVTARDRARRVSAMPGTMRSQAAAGGLRGAVARAHARCRRWSG